MANISFESLHNDRKNFMKKNNNNDHTILEGTSRVLLSAPHGVYQNRLGRVKAPEIGSIATALYLYKKTNSYLIAKTKNNFDDANFDEISLYKKDIHKLIEKDNIKYIIDIHGLSNKRKCDVNLGIHLGHNIENDEPLLENLVSRLGKEHFNVSIDHPFMAGSITLAGSIKNKYKQCWTIQIEINCDITNKKKNFVKHKRLLNVLKEWINHIEMTNN